MRRNKLQEQLRGLRGKGEDGEETESKLVVVVIDDDEMVLESLSLVLSSRYEVRAYSGAEAGVKEATTDDVALVILDVNMPGRDGLWAFDKIRRESDVPIMFLSGDQSPEVVEEVKKRSDKGAALIKGVVRPREILSLTNLRIAATRARNLLTKK